MESSDKLFPDIRTVVHEAINNLEMLYNRKELIYGVPTGFKKLDEKTAGLHGGDLIVIAGRPSIGKTLICINMAEYMAIYEEKNVAFFSLEMSAFLLVQRMISSMTAISIHKLRTGFISEDEWPKIKAAANNLITSKIHFDDSPALTVLDIRSKALNLKAEKGLDIIFIDDLQLVEEHRQSETRTQAITEITRCLKGLARELNVPIVVISQLSKKVKEPPNRRPQLADLREFGAIEQYADIVCFVHRKPGNPHKETKNQLAELIVAKHRNGSIGNVPLVFSEEFIRFENPEVDMPEIEQEDIEESEDNT